MKVLRAVRAASFDHRAVHLTATLAHYENQESTSKIKTKIQRLKRLINIESMRKPYRHINLAIPSSHRSGLSKLFVPSGIKDSKVARFTNADGTLLPEHLIAMAQADKSSVTYDTILDCDRIEQELLRYNRKWFRQAAETPFGHGELFQLLGYDG